MIEWIVSSSLLIIVVAGLGAALKEHLSARFRYALWALVVLRLLLPVTFGEGSFSVEDRLGTIPVVQDAQTLRGVKNLHYDQDSGRVWTYGGLMYDNPEILAEQATETEFQRLETVLGLREVLMPLWRWGMAVMAAVFFFSNLRFTRRLEESGALLETECDVPVYVTEAVETPCLFGLVIPAIYVPPEVAADATALRHCLAHEETHRRHGDHIWAALRCLCLILHWYNPLVWLAAHLSRRHSELACDEGTLLRLGEEERFAYGRTLISLTCEGRDRLLTTTMTGSKKSLTERIGRVAKGTKTAYFAMGLALTVIVVTAGCAFTGAEQKTPPEAAPLAGTAVFRQDGEITAITLHSRSGDSAPVGEEYLAEMTSWARTFTYETYSEEAAAPGSSEFSLTVTYFDGTEQTSGIDFGEVEGVDYAIGRGELPQCWHDAWASADEGTLIEVWSDGETVKVPLASEGAALPTVYLNKDFHIRLGEKPLARGLMAFDMEGNLVNDDKSRYYYHETEVFFLEPGEYICTLGVYNEEGEMEDAAFILSVDKFWTQYEPLHPDKVGTIVKAELWNGGACVTLEDPEALDFISREFSGAKKMGAPACPFGPMLYLTAEDGTEYLCAPATDSCDNFMSAGYYYDYGMQDTQAFWDLFNKD